MLFALLALALPTASPAALEAPTVTARNPPAQSAPEAVPPAVVEPSSTVEVLRGNRARVVNEFDLDATTRRGFSIYVGPRRVTDYTFVKRWERVTGEPPPPEVLAAYEPAVQRNEGLMWGTLGIGAGMIAGGALLAAATRPDGVFFSTTLLIAPGVAMVVFSLVYRLISDVAVPPERPVLSRAYAERLVWQYNSALRDRLWVPPAEKPSPSPPPPSPPPPPARPTWPDDWVQRPGELRLAWTW